MENKGKYIASDLWKIADKLRGTMNASEYQNYILGFIFYKYLSDKQDEYVKREGYEEFYSTLNDREAYISELGSVNGYVILNEYRWNTLIDLINNKEITFDTFVSMFNTFKELAKIDKVKEGVLNFEDVFNDLNLQNSRLGENTGAKTKALSDTMLIIHEMDFSNEDGKDLLGDAYEYLIGLFAANAGQKGGEFYTPHEVSQILAKIVTVKSNKEFSVYDPTMGSGSLLLTVRKELGSDALVNFFGQENNMTTYNLARMNLMMHNVPYKKINVRCADTLGEIDFPINDDTNEPMLFDAVVSNPPYSQAWDAKNPKRLEDPRFEFGIAPATKADFAFVLHSLHHLKHDGTMAVILPHGVLFRGAAEQKIRQALINSNYLDTVIGLPPNLFFGTSIPTCILVFKKNKTNSDVLFIDASKDFEKAKNKNTLTETHIDKILNSYTERVSKDKYSHLATLDEIKENDYNLNIPRYVDSFEEEVEIPLSEITKEIKEIQIKKQKLEGEIYEMLCELTSNDESILQELTEFKELFKK